MSQHSWYFQSMYSRRCPQNTGLWPCRNTSLFYTKTDAVHVPEAALSKYHTDSEMVYLARAWSNM
jgi:hypothetical protein